MFRKMIVIAVMALLAISAQMGTASAGLVNGGFETGDFTGWSVDTGNNWAMVVSPDAQEGTYSAELGTYEAVGTLSQTFSTTIGQAYLVSFWVANDFLDDTNVFQVLWNGQVQTLDPVLEATVAFPYTQYEFITTAAAIDSTIAFNFQNDASVFHLDNVGVAPVPEPSTILLFASGLLTVAAARRKKG